MLGYFFWLAPEKNPKRRKPHKKRFFLKRTVFFGVLFFKKSQKKNPKKEEKLLCCYLLLVLVLLLASETQKNPKNRYVVTCCFFLFCGSETHRVLLLKHRRTPTKTLCVSRTRVFQNRSVVPWCFFLFCCSSCFSKDGVFQKNPKKDFLCLKRCVSEPVCFRKEPLSRRRTRRTILLVLFFLGQKTCCSFLKHTFFSETSSTVFWCYTISFEKTKKQISTDKLNTLPCFYAPPI